MTQGGPGSSTTLWVSHLPSILIFTNFGVGSALAVALAIIALLADS